MRAAYQVHKAATIVAVLIGLLALPAPPSQAGMGYGVSPPFHLDTRGGEYEIVSAEFDSFVYQNGVDTAQLVVLTRNNWGPSETIRLRVRLEPSVGPAFEMGTDDFALEPGEEHESVFTWAIPDTSYVWEFDVRYILESPEPTFSPAWFDRLDPHKFLGTVLPWEVIEGAKFEIRSFWDWAEPHWECTEALVSTVPYLGTSIAVSKFVQQAIMAGSFRASGRTGESGIALWLSGLDALADGLLLVAEGLDPKVKWLTIFLNGGQVARDCFGTDFLDSVLGRERTIPTGQLVDSLAAWAMTSIDSTGVLIADAVFLEGEFILSVDADHASADLDSTSLATVEFIQLDTLGSIVLVQPNIHRFASGPEANPNSVSTVRVQSLAAQPVQVAVLHREADGNLRFSRFPELPLPVDAVITLHLADYIVELALEVDLDGDGSIDFLWYPGEPSSVENATSIAGRGETLLMLGATPNPSVGSTSFVLQSTENLHDVEISVFDVSGREVRRMLLGGLSLGAKHVRWDGRGSDGRRLASGIYQCLATHAGGRSEPLRLVMLR